MDTQAERLNEQLAKIAATKEISPDSNGDVDFDVINQIVRR